MAQKMVRRNTFHTRNTKEKVQGVGCGFSSVRGARGRETVSFTVPGAPGDAKPSYFLRCPGRPGARTLVFYGVRGARGRETLVFYSVRGAQGARNPRILRCPGHPGARNPRIFRCLGRPGAKQTIFGPPRPVKYECFAPRPRKMPLNTTFRSPGRPGTSKTPAKNGKGRAQGGATAEVPPQGPGGT